jgi:cardiolipin synthase
VATVISCIAIILSENRNPIKSLAWVTVLIFFPFVGLIFYLFFGRNPKNKHKLKMHNKRRLLHNRPPRTLDIKDLSISKSNKQIIKLADTLGATPLCIGNEIEIFTNGRDKFEALKRDLKGAKKFILLQYYIFSDDKIGKEISDILIEAVGRGVKVGVIYDHVGSFSVKSKFFERMRKAGVDARPFSRVTFPQVANRINWRNHRKIVVIDGEIGYIGGMNIADRYVYGDAGKNVWRDTHFRVRGAILQLLYYSFASDWSYMGRPLSISAPKSEPVIENNIGMQLLTSGPDGMWPNIAMAFQQAISSATKSVYIQTPYFLPTEALLKALQAAALSKVDVRIMIPRRSDSRLLSLASYSYIGQCLKADIKFYLYEPGMIHSKVLIIDNEMVSAGSTNFDFRSFEHNFEANIFVYDFDFNRKMRDVFFMDIEHCTKLTSARWNRRPFLQRVLESIVRLMSPIL